MPADLSTFSDDEVRALAEGLILPAQVAKMPKRTEDGDRVANGWYTLRYAVKAEVESRGIDVGLSVKEAFE